MFKELKAKVDNYFEEHPNVKKGLKVAAGLTAGAVAVYAGYKIGKSSVPKLEALPEIPEIPKLPEKEIHEAIDSVIRADDNASFDMIFRDVETGKKIVIADGCLGSYVNDMIDGFEDYPNKQVFVED